MSAEGLFTVAGLLLAVFAILPAERRLDLQLRLNWIDWTILGVAIALLHYITFLPVLEKLGIALRLGPWRWGFTPETASYLILVGAFTFVFTHARFSSLSPRRAAKFRALAESLLHEGKTVDLVYLLQRHLRGLVAIYENRFLLTKLREQIEPRPGLSVRVTRRTPSSDTGEADPSAVEEIARAVKAGGGRAREVLSRTRFEPARERWHASARRWIARHLPSRDRESEEAHHALRRLLRSTAFADALAEVRPEFALDLLRAPLRDRYEFQTLFVRALLRDTNSVLYFEIENSQNIVGSRYQIPEGNRFLQFYLSDAHVADDYGIFKPFGDYALQDLDARLALGASDTYNQPLGTFDDDGRRTSSLVAIVRFFDLMVREALHQGVQSHMWLHYMPPIVEKIVRNLAHQAPEVDALREWPTPYHYLLYEIVAALRDWIIAVTDLPTARRRNDVDDAEFRHTIAEEASVALGQTLKTILLAPTVSRRFRSYIVEIIFRAYFRLKPVPGYSGYARVMLKSLRNGGRFREHRPTTYVEDLADVLDGIDLIPFDSEQVEEVRSYLRAPPATPLA